MSRIIPFISQNMLELKKIKLSTFEPVVPENLNLRSHVKSINIDIRNIDLILHLQNITQIYFFATRNELYESHLIAMTQNLHNLEIIEIQTAEAISIGTISGAACKKIVKIPSNSIWKCFMAIQ